MSWDEFPNGRWGDGRSPAFGDLSDYHLCSLTTAKAATRTSMWGEAPSSYDDVAAVFCKYIRGEIPKLPWCETQLNLETVSLVDFLVRMNSALFLSINSQPRINGAPSTDAAVGWGAVGGYVFQKVRHACVRCVRCVFKNTYSLHGQRACNLPFTTVAE
jgi:methylenetetrahydrofolate reductase (NADPH)